MIPYDIRQQHDGNLNAPHLLSPADAARLENGEYRRAGGEVRCETCGEFYLDHPPLVGALWLNVLCSGELVKL